MSDKACFWFSIVVLIVSLLGGIPGIRTIYRLHKIVSSVLCFFLGHIIGDCFWDNLNYHTNCTRCHKELIKKYAFERWQEVAKYTGWQTDADRVSCPKC